METSYKQLVVKERAAWMLHHDGSLLHVVPGQNCLGHASRGEEFREPKPPPDFDSDFEGRREHSQGARRRGRRRTYGLGG